MHSYALTTRSRVMNYMGVSSLSTTKENLLDRLIDSVTDFIENYCHRRFKLTTYTNEEYDGDGSEYINLKQYPIGTFTSLQYRNSSLNESSWTTVSSDEYFINYSAGIIQMAGGGKFSKNTRGYRVTYTAGFDYDNVTTFLSDAGAADLEYAVWKLIKTAFDKSGGEMGVESERIGDYSVTYTSGMFENKEIKEIVDKYRAMEVFSYTSPINY